MRDHDDRYGLRQFANGVLQHPFFGIDVRRRLVQNNHGAVFYVCAGNGDALFFATRNAHAALTDDRIVPVRERGCKASRLIKPGFVGGT